MQAGSPIIVRVEVKIVCVSSPRFNRALVLFVHRASWESANTVDEKSNLIIDDNHYESDQYANLIVRSQ